MRPAEFLASVWEYTAEKGGFVFLATKQKGGSWTDYPIKVTGSLETDLEQFFKQHPAKKQDIYFCPTSFTGKKRLKQFCNPLNVLYSDIDNGKPHISPTSLWESSPNRLQGLWFLDERLSVTEGEELNRNLTYYMDADTGGWDVTQVLRVPGTYNHKYTDLPKVRSIHHRIKKRFSFIEINNKVEGSAPKIDEVDDHTIRASEKPFEELFRKHYKKFPTRVKQLLSAQSTAAGDRSSLLWYLFHELSALRISDGEVIGLIKGSVWNKFKGRDSEEHQLSRELKKVRAKSNGKSKAKARTASTSKSVSKQKRAKRKNRTPKNTALIEQDDTAEEASESGYTFVGDDVQESVRPVDEEEEDEEEVTLEVESYAQVMQSRESSPGWLVEDYWLKESHGIVAGEPKSFKSTLVLDMCVSIASGEPFHGHEILSPGPVLYIQNENAAWIMQDRLEKMTNEKGLVGAVHIDDDSITVEWPEDLPLHFVNNTGFMLTDPTHQLLFEAMLEKYRPVMVVLDPLYLMFEGSLNVADEITPILRFLMGMRFKYKTAMCVIHHYNKGGAATTSRGGQRMLGSTTLHGWIESAWYIQAHSEMDEESDNPDATITLQREFRGSGITPPVDITIGMGDVGEAKYSVSIDKHVPQMEEKDKPKNNGSADRDIIGYLKTRKEGATESAIISHTGYRTDIVRNMIDTLCAAGKLKRKGPQVSLC